MSSPEKPGFLRGLARGLVKIYYPRIEVTGGALIPRTGPVLLVANHPNSLIDPVLLGIAARRPVRLMAKAPLFEVPLLGALLRAVGMVPAYRGSDDVRQVTKNLESIAAAAGHLAEGAVLGIFPEGRSHDAPQLAQVRSGAARLAMQAVGLGAKDLRVVPVGINYERKERFRTAVWIKLGRPIDAANWLRGHGGDERRAMRTLTQEIDARLRHCAIHLDHAAWEPLLGDVEPLLGDVEALLPPAPGGRGAALANLHRRLRAAQAINHFQRTNPDRAAAAAERVRAHAAALRRVGVAADARLLAWRGPVLAAVMGRDALLMGAATAVALPGLLHHLLPYGVVRLLAGRLAGPGRMVVALLRLLLSLPIYAAWYAFVWWRLNLYFVPWVAWTWVLAMPLAGLGSLAAIRWLRSAGRLWWAEARLLGNRRRAAALRTEHAAVRRLLEEFATEVKLPTRIGPAKAASIVLRPPRWLSALAGGIAAAVVLALGPWLLRDRPHEFWRRDAPELAALATAALAERLAGEERALEAVLAGLAELEARFRKFEAALALGERSYYRPEDDDEIRRMLASFLSFRTALLRTGWHFQRHEEIGDERPRLRALLLHYAAAAVAYDYSARFVRAFDGRTTAIRKLNEAEPRWDLPPGIYDTIRANLAHLAHRRWLEAGWSHYHATLPRWRAAGLYEREPHAGFHRAIAVAGENTAHLAGELFRYKLATAAADAGKLARGGWYRASSAVSTLIGDTKIREPRHGAALITAELLAALRPRLRPGDIVIERRNWYLSNAFLPGYWPHSALYVGTVADLRALGLEGDPRVARHLAALARPDAAGRARVFLEAVSEGVVFTSAGHSIGEADSVAVLRPRLTPDQIREAIARAFSHAGKPYDFDFDFFSADKLVCTELVHRAYGSLIDFPLVEILGRQTLPALEMVRFWASPQGAPQLEFVAFLDGDERSGTCTERDAVALKESISRPALTWRQ